MITFEKQDETEEGKTVGAYVYLGESSEQKKETRKKIIYSCY